MSKHTLTKIIGDRYCSITVELESKLDSPVSRLSITGSTGHVLTEAQGKRQALQTWIDYFDENPGEIIAMGKRFGRKFSSSRGAARFVIDCDGVLHGLDVEKVIGSGRKARVLVTEACGQICDELTEWFPEWSDLFPYHLNDMKAGAPDQERALDSAPRDWWRKLPGGKYGPDFYSHACMALALGGILESRSDEQIYVTGHGERTARGYRYGSGWVSVPLPEAIVARVAEFMNTEAE